MTETGAHNVELTASEWAELLDPKSWAHILTLYARSMGIAVALVDPQGQTLRGMSQSAAHLESGSRRKTRMGSRLPFCLELGEGSPLPLKR